MRTRSDVGGGATRCGTLISSWWASTLDAVAGAAGKAEPDARAAPARRVRAGRGTRSMHRDMGPGAEYGHCRGRP